MALRLVGEKMSKKALSLGMIIPLAAAGAVATAPTASANSGHHSSVSCELKAWRHHDDIKLKLEVDSKGHQGREFKVRIFQNGHRILNRSVWDKNGEFTQYKTADDKRGTDFFWATVRNVKSGDDDTCRVKVSRR